VIIIEEMDIVNIVLIIIKVETEVEIEVIVMIDERRIIIGKAKAAVQTIIVVQVDKEVGIESIDEDEDQ